ncbi:hypothetical protein DDW44_25840 [Streptomyces tirandamycinicus]|uniref:Uncharacterized protein n=1 Tax=Streptomyces tirandamycinicus TaxID=2174846 RepID=A0A2S1SZI2_9ACTN|nr:hypothetical protein DDW44_25840 [Streptomyces tirandamycinicus]
MPGDPVAPTAPSPHRQGEGELIALGRHPVQGSRVRTGRHSTTASATATGTSTAAGTDRPEAIFERATAAAYTASPRAACTA